MFGFDFFFQLPSLDANGTDFLFTLAVRHFEFYYISVLKCNLEKKLN